MDTAILYSLELTASLSVLLLAFGLIATMANVLTKGSVVLLIVAHALRHVETVKSGQTASPANTGRPVASTHGASLLLPSKMGEISVSLF